MSQNETERPREGTSRPFRGFKSSTRSLRTLQGLLGSQLPALPTINLNNAKLYPDQPKIEKGDGKSQWTGIRSESLAIIPTRAGEFVLPEVRIAWWNTDSNKAEYAILPERKFTVAPAVANDGDTHRGSPESRLDSQTRAPD